MAKIVIATDTYNEKRYSRPYIGLCDPQAKPTSWGKWLGTDGRAGELSLDVPDLGPCIIIRGQKDFRGNNGSPQYSIAIDGKLEDDWTSDKMNAVQRYRAALQAQSTPKPEPVVNVTELQSERDRLLNRLGEIDAILASEAPTDESAGHAPRQRSF